MVREQPLTKRDHGFEGRRALCLDSFDQERPSFGRLGHILGSRGQWAARNAQAAVLAAVSLRESLYMASSQLYAHLGCSGVFSQHRTTKAPRFLTMYS